MCLFQRVMTSKSSVQKYDVLIGMLCRLYSLRFQHIHLTSKIYA